MKFARCRARPPHASGRPVRRRLGPRARPPSHWLWAKASLIASRAQLPIAFAHSPASKFSPKATALEFVIRAAGRGYVRRLQPDACGPRVIKTRRARLQGQCLCKYSLRSPLYFLSHSSHLEPNGAAVALARPLPIGRRLHTARSPRPSAPRLLGSARSGEIPTQIPAQK